MATATIYDVATHAGVSISTVSHTLNRPHRVNAETRQRVMRAIDELGYVPKATAVARARKSVGRVGVLAPFTSYASYARRLMGVLKEAEGDATEIVLYDQPSAASTTSPLLSSLPVTHRLDGLLIMGLPLDDPLAERLLAQKLPTVLVDSARPELDSITIDDHAAGYLVGPHLIDRGRRTFAYISEAQRSAATSRRDSADGGLRRGVHRRRHRSRRDASALTTTSLVDVPRSRDGRRAACRTPFSRTRTASPPASCSSASDGAYACPTTWRSWDSTTEISEALDITTVWQPLEESGRLGFRQLREAIGGVATAPRTPPSASSSSSDRPPDRTRAWSTTAVVRPAKCFYRIC